MAKLSHKESFNHGLTVTIQNILTGIWRQEFCDPNG